LLHALNAAATITAENTIEYFMECPITVWEKAGKPRAHATRAANRRQQTIPGALLRFRALARI
jgi:hypothetical protein